MVNNIGKIIEVRPILQKHNGEIRCAVCGKGFDVEGWKNINKLY